MCPSSFCFLYFTKDSYTLTIDMRLTLNIKILSDLLSSQGLTVSMEQCIPFLLSQIPKTTSTFLMSQLARMASSNIHPKFAPSAYREY